MKYIKNYKVFEGMGDNLNDNNYHLELLKDLSLDITDIGFKVDIKGYESYKEGYNMYDIFITGKDKFNVYDINKENLSNLKEMNNRLGELNKLNIECLNLITRSVENDLYLCQYEIDIDSIDSTISIYIRFTIKQDGKPVNKDFKYYDEDELD
jgi:hypothetical protein